MGWLHVTVADSPSKPDAKGNVIFPRWLVVKNRRLRFDSDSDDGELAVAGVYMNIRIFEEAKKRFCRPENSSQYANRVISLTLTRNLVGLSHPISSQHVHAFITSVLLPRSHNCYLEIHLPRISAPSESRSVCASLDPDVKRPCRPTTGTC